MNKPLLITMGDAAGIGPEIIAKAFRDAPAEMAGCAWWVMWRRCDAIRRWWHRRWPFPWHTLKACPTCRACRRAASPCYKNVS
jgi:hypothetical protein